MKEYKIKFNRPAREWVDALPVGNGKMGAMVYGGFPVEHIQLNEESIWAGPPYPETKDDAGEVLGKARELFFEGNSDEGQELIHKNLMVDRIHPRSYQPLGDLFITHLDSDMPQPIKISDWHRAPADCEMSDEIAESEIIPEEWKKVVAAEDYVASADRNIIFKTLFTLSEKELGEYKNGYFKLLHVTAKSQAFLNGKEIEGTATWRNRHTVSADEVVAGVNVFTVVVKCRGKGNEPVCMAKSVELFPDFTEDCFKRELSLNNAVATAKMSGIKTEVLASAPDDAVIVNIKSDNGPMKLKIEYSREVDFKAEIIDGAITISGQANHHGTHYGVKWNSCLKAIVNSGTVTSSGDDLIIEDATEVTLLIVAATNYNKNSPEEPLLVERLRLCQDKLAAISGMGFKELKERSVRDHKKLFNRCEFELNGSGLSDFTTPERLENLIAGNEDFDLIETYFQFGRYLLICSSRPGSLVSQLQGKWNQLLVAPWNCDYHTNINLQMNYWPAEVTGLSECHEPMFHLIDQIRVGKGKELARKLGCDGFSIGHTTDIWHYAALFGEPQFGMWPMGAGWCVSHLMEHYRFTQNSEFLRDIAYPMLKDASLFFLDWLVEDPETGKLVSGPTTSPENSYILNGKELSLSMGTTMDQMIIWDTFTNTLEAAEAIEISDNFITNVKSALENLAQPKIAPDGRLMEWEKDYPETEPGHRHISHLYGFHPGCQINSIDTPDLYNAARKTLEHRLSHGGGHTGWSRAWIINFYARFKDGNAAYENILALLNKSTLSNLFDNHSPFQIDGNFGGTAGIVEMLLQSHGKENIIQILPALPEAWRSGSIKGIKARGGFTVCLEWSDNTLDKLTISSEKGGKATVQYGDKSWNIDLARGEQLKINSF